MEMTYQTPMILHDPALTTDQPPPPNGYLTKHRVIIYTSPDIRIHDSDGMIHFQTSDDYDTRYDDGFIGPHEPYDQ